MANRAQRDERDLLANLRTQLRQCVGFEGDKLANDRMTAWRYYFMRPRGDEVTGRSNVVSGDISAMTEAVLAQADDAFSTDRLVEFEAFSAEDTDQAQLESDTVCQFIARSNGKWQLLNAIKSALLLRNGIIKIWVERKENTERKEYINVTLDAIAELAKPIEGIDTEIIDYDPETGDLILDVTSYTQKLRANAIPMANFIYPDDWNSIDLAECPFMAERHYEERAKLIERGFSKDKVDKVRTSTSDPAIDAQTQSPGGFSNTRAGLDHSQDRVEWFEAWCYMDDGKGKCQRRVISFAENVILDNTIDDLVPYAGGCVFINPNRFTGISLYDKLKTNQDVNTGLERALLDNVNTVNKNRTASFDGLVNVDDLSDGRTNNNIRVRFGVVPDVRQAITAFTIPDQSAGILSNIQDQRQRRAEMGGAALTLATGEMQLNDRVGSQGIDRAYSVMEQLSAHMVGNVATTLIRSMYLIAHETMRRNFDFPVTIRQGGRWTSTIPSQWPKRENCVPKPGMSPGERARRVATFRDMMTGQIELAQSGMDEVLVSMDTFYTTMMDWARTADIDNPERYYVDPRSPAAQKAMAGKQKQSGEQAKMQNLLITQAIKLEQIRSAVDKYRIDVETQFKYYDANLTAQIEEAKIVGSATTDFLKLIHTPPKGANTNGKGNGRAEESSEATTGESATT